MTMPAVTNNQCRKACYFVSFLTRLRWLQPHLLVLNWWDCHIIRDRCLCEIWGSLPFKSKMISKAQWFFEMSRSPYPPTHCDFPEDIKFLISSYLTTSCVLIIPTLSAQFAILQQQRLISLWKLPDQVLLPPIFPL